MKALILLAVLTFAIIPCTAQVNPTKTASLTTELAQSKHDSVRVRVFIQLAEHYFGPSSKPIKPDSMQYYLLQARKLNSIVRSAILNNRINLLAAEFAFGQATGQDPRDIYLPVIDTCKQTNDVYFEMHTWIALGDAMGRDLKVADYKLKCYENARRLSQQLQDKNREMRLRRQIADIHLQQRNYDLAISELKYVIGQADNIQPAMVMYAYDLLAGVYMAKGEYDKALMNALKTVKIMEAIGDSSRAITFYNRLSVIYVMLGKNEEAFYWDNRLLSYSISTNNTQRFFQTVITITVNLSGRRKHQEALDFILKQTANNKPTEINDRRAIERVIADCYNNVRRFDMAEKHYEQLIKLAAQQTQGYSTYDKGADNYSLGLFYLGRGKYARARKFLENALFYFEQNGVLHFVKQAHLALFKTDSCMGNNVSAIKHLQLNKDLSDSLFNIERNKQVEELNIAYKTEEKDKNMQLLAQKEQLTRAELQYAQSTRNWIIAAATLLLIIASLLFRQASIRKKNNTIIKSKNEQLQHLLTEKEWLLKEVHHRVKNNLHTVIGLLNSQAAYLQDDALKANEVSKHRIFAMSLIHQQLYNANDIKAIDMSVYLPELVDYLRESFGTSRQILFHLQIEPIRLTGGQAVPLALIVNEAITNSIKYAFPSNRLGTITISMNEDNKNITLSIADDGVGIDPALFTSESTSLGLKLIRGLTEDIDGQISFTNEGGTRIIITFEPDPLRGHATLKAV